MATTLCAITVEPGGLTVVADITGVTCYTAENGSSVVTFPQTITTSTSYYVGGTPTTRGVRGSFATATVSLESASGIEVASRGGAARAIPLYEGVNVSVVPVWEAGIDNVVGGVEAQSLSRTITDQAGANPTYVTDDQIHYRTTDVAVATAIGAVGYRQDVYVGSSSIPVSATGSVLGIASSVIVKNTSQAGAEHSPLFSVLRYDQGTGFSNSGTPGRGWLADLTIHGAIGTQQQVLTGVNVVLANYYNGQPSENPSCAYSASAGTGIGGSLDATHAAASRFPGGDGYWVGGVTTSSARGFDYGFRVGGSGGPWNVTTSKVGYGFAARDYDTAGLRLFTRSGTAASIIVESDGGPIAIGRSTALSTVATISGTFAAPAADPASQMVSFLTNDVQLADRGASIGLGGTTVDAATTWRNFALIAGRKLNSTTADTSGYIQIQVNKSGVGLQQVLKISIDGAMTLFDGGSITCGATTGTKIGSATSDKLAFHNSTPVIQRAGAAQAAVGTTGATQTTPFGYTTAAQADAIVTLVNEIRATLVEKGLMKGAA